MKTENNKFISNLIKVGGHKKISPESIIWMEGDINYTKLHLCTGKILIVATTLKKLEQRFSENSHFFRTHKSCIINLSYVTDFQIDSLELQNNLNVIVSRRRKEALLERIENYRIAS